MEKSNKTEWSFRGLRVPTPNPARSRQFRASYAEAQQYMYNQI